MAQSAKLLNPDKKVLLPNMKSGCLMANMINTDLLKEFKAKFVPKEEALSRIQYHKSPQNSHIKSVKEKD